MYLTLRDSRVVFQSIRQHTDQMLQVAAEVRGGAKTWTQILSHVVKIERYADTIASENEPSAGLWMFALYQLSRSSICKNIDNR